MSLGWGAPPTNNMFKIMSAMVASTKAMLEEGTKVFGKLQCFESSSNSRNQMELMKKLEDASEAWKLISLI